MLKMGKHWNS